MKSDQLRRVLFMTMTGLFAGTPCTAQASYDEKVLTLIGNSYSYPRSAHVRGDQGTAKIKITISGSGQVVAVELVQTTGSAILDREALRIPRKIGTFPIPAGGRTKTVIVPITWRIS